MPLLGFEIEAFDGAVEHARELRAGGPAHRELWIRDRDGDSVVLASPHGEAA